MKRRQIIATSSASLVATLGFKKLSARAQKQPKQGRYTCRILAIDGGGIRGVIPAYILQQLETQLGKRIYECFDIIAGTSTGGIISLALTTPIPSKRNSHKTPSKCSFYVQHSGSRSAITELAA